MRFLLFVVLIAGSATASRGDPPQSQDAKTYYAGAGVPKGRAIPRAEIEVRGFEDPNALFGKKPKCVPYDPSAPLTLTLQLKKPRLVTGFKFRTTASDSLDAAREHGRVREMKIDVEGASATREFVDRTALPKRQPPSEVPGRPLDDGRVITTADLTRSLPHSDSVSLGLGTGIVDRNLVPTSTSSVKIQIAAYYHGTKHHDVCVSNFEIFAVDEPADAR